MLARGKLYEKIRGSAVVPEMIGMGKIWLLPTTDAMCISRALGMAAIWCRNSRKESLSHRAIVYFTGHGKNAQVFPSIAETVYGTVQTKLLLATIDRLPKYILHAIRCFPLKVLAALEVGPGFSTSGRASRS
jgi:hypothetical protein